MSLFRDLSKAAIEADFGKNAFKVFNTLLHQTLGYGKEKDNLTDKRLAQLSCVRLDRVRPAIQCVINTGLFDREPSNEYDWHYCIGATHLAKHAQEQQEKNAKALHKNPNATPQKPQFFTPALPKNGANFQKTDEISENQSHTALDLNQFLPYLQQLLHSFTPPAPTSLALETNATNAIATSVAEQLSTPLSQLSESLSTSISSSLSGALQQALQPLQDQFTQHLDTVVHINQQLNHLSRQRYEQRYEPCGGDEKMFKSAEPEPASLHNVPFTDNQMNNQAERAPSAKQSENQNPTDLSTDKQKQPPEAEPQNENSSESTQTEHHDIAIQLPDLVEHSAYSRCYKLLHQLTEEKQRDVLNVFNEMEMNNKIRDNPTGLFIQLTKRAKKEALTVSKKDKRGGSRNPFANPHPDHPNIQYGYSQSPDGMRYY